MVVRMKEVISSEVLHHLEVDSILHHLANLHKKIKIESCTKVALPTVCQLARMICVLSTEYDVWYSLGSNNHFDALILPGNKGAMTHWLVILDFNPIIYIYFISFRILVLDINGETIHYQMILIYPNKFIDDYITEQTLFITMSKICLSVLLCFTSNK